MSFLEWIGNLSFNTWVCESSSLWSFPLILFLHTVGLGLLVGPSVVIGLRLLSVGKNLPLTPLKRLYPIMWAGFRINAASGFPLLIGDATAKLIDWHFYTTEPWRRSHPSCENARSYAGDSFVRFSVSFGSTNI